MPPGMGGSKKRGMCYFEAAASLARRSALSRFAVVIFAPSVEDRDRRQRLCQGRLPRLSTRAYVGRRLELRFSFK